MRVDMKISASDHERVLGHLFRDDHDEHGVALLAAPHVHGEHADRLTLLVQEVIPVKRRTLRPGAARIPPDRAALHCAARGARR
jgi:hypothetical protein